jgi:Do/DeqQ family serine protease
MWKKVVAIVAVAIVSFVTSIGAVTYIVKHNKGIQAALMEGNASFNQPVRMTNFASVAAENTDFTYAAEQAIQAVVHIKSVAKSQRGKDGGRRDFDPFEYFFGFGGNAPRQQQPRVGFGSGVIISTDGYIITNNHVVEGADELEVTLNDNREFRAKIIGTDPSTDIALLKVEATDLHTLPYGDSEQLKVGEWVLAVGNPFRLKSTVTSGIVSAKGRSIMTGESNLNKIESFIQTDAAVNPGNSGGALVNTKGELVGINTAIYSETGNFAGYSFAVPISIAGKVVADLKQYGTVQRARLGVMMLPPQDAKNELKDDKITMLEGACVVEFAERSPAKEAGVEVGDVITAVNDVKVKSPSALQEQINKYRPGDKVKIELDRHGTKKVITVELRNVRGGTEVIGKTDRNSAEILGAAVRELTADQKQTSGVGYGIEVNGINKGKIQDAGIRKGFVIMIVNDQKIETPDDLYRIVDKILKNSSEEQGLFAEEQGLFIKGFYPNGSTRHYAIDLTE